MQEADKIRPKQENIIVKEGGRLIIFWGPNRFFFLVQIITDLDH